MNLVKPITTTLHIVEIINRWRCRHWGGSGARGGGLVQVAHGGLAWMERWGNATYCVHFLVLHIVLPLIHIRTFLSIGLKKILHTIWYSRLCNETPEAMPKKLVLWRAKGWGNIMHFGWSIMKRCLGEKGRIVDVIFRGKISRAVYPSH